MTAKPHDEIACAAQGTHVILADRAAPDALAYYTAALEFRGEHADPMAMERLRLLAARARGRQGHHRVLGAHELVLDRLQLLATQHALDLARGAKERVAKLEVRLLLRLRRLAGALKIIVAHNLWRSQPLVVRLQVLVRGWGWLLLVLVGVFYRLLVILRRRLLLRPHKQLSNKQILTQQHHNSNNNRIQLHLHCPM